MKKISKVCYLVVALVVLGVAAYFLGKPDTKETISFDTATVGQTNIQNSITATGTIEPVTSVTVGTQVSGIVSKLYVDYNSVVKKGQVIAELDKTNLLSALNQAKAMLESAQAQVRSAESDVQKAQADYNGVRASASYQQSNFSRYQTLYKKGLISANDFESARLSYQQAQQNLAASAQTIATARQGVAQAREQVRQQQEQVKQAQTNLGYATITSPIDGVVLSKSVEEGQTVAASFSTPELFTIAKDLTNMQVVANVDEADIGEVKTGERVSLHRRCLSRRHLHRYGEAGAPGGHDDQQRRHLRGRHQCPQRRPQTQTRTDGQRHHLYPGACGRDGRLQQGPPLHPYARDRRQAV